MLGQILSETLWLMNKTMLMSKRIQQALYFGPPFNKFTDRKTCGNIAGRRLRLTYRSNIARYVGEAKPAGSPVAFLNKRKVSRWVGTKHYTNFLRLLRTPVETVRFSLPCSEEGAAAPKATKAMETAMSLVK